MSTVLYDPLRPVARRHTGRSGAQFLAAAAGIVLCVPTTLAAQKDPGLFELFASRKEQSSQPLFGGIALSGYSGVFGLRLSGALNLVNRDETRTASPQFFAEGPRGRRGPRYYPSGYSDGFGPGIGAWSADADLVFEPLRPTPVLRALLLGFSPYVFAGIGGVGIRPDTAADTTRAMYSYGAGVHHTLLGPASLTMEARYRRPFNESASSYTADLRNRLEYRVGIAFAFGGPSKPRAARGPLGAPSPSESASAPVVPTAEYISSVLDLAEGLMDTPYRDGGTDPAEGFSAGGFVQYVFGKQGISLPATAREIAREGEAVSTRIGSLRPGDLLFFANNGRTIDHVAIYAGPDRIIHASASAGRVQTDMLGEGERGQWFSDHLVAARRIRSATGTRRATTGDRDGAPPSGRAP